MKYKELLKETNEEVEERLELVLERVAEIAEEPGVEAPYGEYFQKTASFLKVLASVVEKAESGELSTMTAEEGKALNEKLYEDVAKANYETSYANPAYAVKMLGTEYGQVLSAIYTRCRSAITYVFQGDKEMLCLYAELFMEIYTQFENMEDLTPGLIRENYYSFMHDNSEVFNTDRVNRIVNPDYDYNYGIVMDADLSDSRYLYQYGLNITADEVGISEFMNTFSEEEIQAMADTYTEGYRMGFENTQRDLSGKKTVGLRYPAGFERMVRAAVKNFQKLGLRPTMTPSSSAVNKQYSYDHREDHALFLDKAFVERSLEVYRLAFEQNRELCSVYAGPAVIEEFGEEPFSPVTKEEAVKLTEKQQQLYVYQESEFGQIWNQYIKGEETSFTIIAYPVPSIGEKFQEIFAETVKLNTLDYMLYRNMQQKIIDVLDTADHVHIVGAEGNKTDLIVNVYDLTDPTKQTIFENCVADVNIPVGEVFTSPVLKGTTGKLHVSQVYLHGLNYLNLEIDFKDGMITDYTCTNFETEEENKKYIQDNVLYHHETLPIGEFAIGTNTTAYRMARQYDVAAKLPILIAEKTGPHFAVGDTCYSHSEDTPVFNPDGKEIVARDNEVSLLRKSDVSKAYFNCHTDITIPYDELGKITAVGADGTETDIIADGRFVVPGTEELNKPLDEM